MSHLLPFLNFHCSSVMKSEVEQTIAFRRLLPNPRLKAIVVCEA